MYALLVICDNVLMLVLMFCCSDTFGVPLLSPGKGSSGLKSPSLTSPKRGAGKKEDGWKEVIRK